VSNRGEQVAAQTLELLQPSAQPTLRERVGSQLIAERGPNVQRLRASLTHPHHAQLNELFEQLNRSLAIDKGTLDLETPHELSGRAGCIEQPHCCPEEGVTPVGWAELHQGSIVALVSDASDRRRAGAFMCRSPAFRPNYMARIQPVPEATDSCVETPANSAPRLPWPGASGYPGEETTHGHDGSQKSRTIALGNDR
jgi:hypothetical protein